MGRGAMTLLALQVSDMIEVPGDYGVQGTPELTVRDAIATRRTVRSFSDRPLTKDQVMDLLWAAQGITDNARGFRSVPSAGALYPIELYVAVGLASVTGLEEGLYHYSPRGHFLEKEAGEDLRQKLAAASLSQMWMAQAPVSLVICGVYGRTTRKYGDRGVRYVHMEAGCVTENVFLMAVAMGLSAGIVGAFEDTAVAEILNLPTGTEPLLILPAGYAG